MLYLAETWKSSLGTVQRAWITRCQVVIAFRGQTIYGVVVLNSWWPAGMPAVACGHLRVARGRGVTVFLSTTATSQDKLLDYGDLVP